MDNYLDLNEPKLNDLETLIVIHRYLNIISEQVQGILEHLGKPEGFK